MAFKAEEHKDDADFLAFIKTTTESAVDAATGDLKSKVEELIGEKRKATDLLKGFDGLDPEAAKTAMKFLETNETARLLAEGKGDEVIAALTEKLKATHQEEITTLNTKMEEISTNATNYKNMYEKKIVEDEIRTMAMKEGLLPEAIEDVLFRAHGIFSIGEDGTIEARDQKGELVKLDDKLLTPGDWVTKLPRHYWPASANADINGKGQASKIDSQIAAAAANGNQAEYQRLRKLKKTGKAA